MAAAAIGIIAPLVAPLVPEVINLIVALVHKAAPIAEAANGPLTGPVKFADVFASVQQDLVKAETLKQISAIPSDADTKTIIQAVVTSMQLAGLLTPAAAPLLSPAATAVLPQATNNVSSSVRAGQTITITITGA